MKEDILNELNKRLEEIMKDTGNTISACREKVVIQAKKEGLIKDYLWTKNRTSKSNNVIYFGSCVGFDSMYKIMIQPND